MPASASAAAGQPLGVGLYGANGHQIQRLLAGHPRARLVAVAELGDHSLPPEARADPALRRHESLDAMLADPRVRLVSLCSPRRDRQAEEAARVLAAGRHVYAEKPCAVNVAELDRLQAAIRAAAARGVFFREMGDTVFSNPWYSLRALARSGALGEVVQVYAQKSYPWHASRSPDNGVDGGIIPWVAVHAVRMVEQIGGVRISEVVAARRTPLGSPDDSGLDMAAAVIYRLENGGLATVTANYLNPRGFPTHGNETIRLFGSKGMGEIVDGGARTRWVDAQADRGPIPEVAAPPDYFSAYVAEILDGAPMELPLDEELHATRMTLLANEVANSQFIMHN